MRECLELLSYLSEGMKQPTTHGLDENQGAVAMHSLRQSYRIPSQKLSHAPAQDRERFETMKQKVKRAG